MRAVKHFPVSDNYDSITKQKEKKTQAKAQNPNQTLTPAHPCQTDRRTRTGKEFKQKQKPMYDVYKDIRLIL